MRTFYLFITKIALLFVLFSVLYTDKTWAHDLSVICLQENQCIKKNGAVYYIFENRLFSNFSNGYVDEIKTKFQSKELFLLKNNFLVVRTDIDDLYILAPDDKGTERFWVQIGYRISKVLSDKENLIAIYEGRWRFSKPTIVWFNLKKEQIVHRQAENMEYTCGLNNYCPFGSVMTGTYKEKFPFTNLEIINFTNILLQDKKIHIEFRGKVILPLEAILRNKSLI